MISPLQLRIRCQAFTLIELLVSLSLMAFLITSATFAFTQVRTMTRRIQARQSLHNTARIIYETMRAQIDAMHQGSAFYLRSHGTGPLSEPREIELIFLHGKYDTVDFTFEDNFGMYVTRNTDHQWTRWSWQSGSGHLSVATSAAMRRFSLTEDWIRNGVNYKGQDFLFLPQHQRLAGGSPETLDSNAFGTPSTDDYGDYTDLIRNRSVIATNCTDLRFEISLQDEDIISASTDTDSSYAIDGLRVDGTGTSGRRPRIIRVRFSLTDEGTQLVEDFSFSFLAPGLLAQ